LPLAQSPGRVRPQTSEAAGFGALSDEAGAAGGSSRNDNGRCSLWRGNRNFFVSEGVEDAAGAVS